MPTLPALHQTLLLKRSDGDPSSGAIIGAVLGSIFGFLVLVTLVYKCCYDNRSAAWIPPFVYYDEGSSRKRTPYYASSKPPPRSGKKKKGQEGPVVKHRGGGLEDYDDGKWNWESIGRPRKVKTRSVGKKSEVELQFETRRYSRRGNVGQRDGMLGVFLERRPVVRRESVVWIERVGDD